MKRIKDLFRGGRTRAKAAVTSEPRNSVASLRLLRAFLDAPAYRAAGYDLMRATSLSSGTIYPALARFEEAGWVTAAWEKIDQSEAGRPRRRYYRLTGEGQRVAHERLSEFALPEVTLWAT